MSWLPILAAAAVVVIAVIAISRANELFFVSVRDGRCLVVRGSVPPSLWSELRAVIAASGAKRGSVRAFKQGGRARIEVRGLGDAVAQRLRNAFGARGFHRAAASAQPACGSRNLGQLLGIAWLAWLFTRDG